MFTYKVQYGDSLHSIAYRFGISVQILAMSNNIFNPDHIFEGQELLIPIALPIMDLSFRNSRQENILDNIKYIFSQEGTTAGGIFKFTFPRTDLTVKIGDIIIEPELALTSWVALNQLEPHSILMGDIVLLQNEVNPVMSVLLENGIEITALHNHLMFETPRIMFMHIHGEGDPISLAKGVRNALSQTSTSFDNIKQQIIPQVNWSLIEDILERKGSHKGNVLQMSFPRDITISEQGHLLSPSMGISHGINFQLVGNKVATTGDFVLLDNEVNSVAHILRENNITVTAIHNHMLKEVPRLFYMHFWAVGKPEYLVRVFKSVLDLAK